MSYTSKQGIGGSSRIRRQSQAADKALLRKPLEPGTRNARRFMKKLRDRYGDDVIDEEIRKFNNKYGDK